MKSAVFNRRRMIRIFITTFFLLSILSLRAQEKISLSTQSYNEFSSAPLSPVIRKPLDVGSFKPLRSTFRIPGERQKKIGSTMVALGGAMIVGGIVMYSGSDKTPSKDSVLNNYGQWEVYNVYDPKYVFGILCIVVGTGATVPGILIWRKGIKRYDQYMIEQENLSFYFHGTGGTVRYRF